MKKVIFDLGANVGKNLNYYLQKSDLVVAVEPNPRLSQGLRKKFESAIHEQRLVVVESAVTHREAGSRVSLFISPDDSGLTSTVEPDFANDWNELRVDAVSVLDLFERFGSPYFVKIDLEGHDAVVLKEVLEWKPLPEFIAVEGHDPRVVALLLLQSDFEAFKVVQGKRVHIDYSHHPIATRDGRRWWHFEWHSAGPFGVDLPGKWLDRSGLVRQYGAVGPGWVDIHAARAVVYDTKSDQVLRHRSAGPEAPRPRSQQLHYALECFAVACGRIPMALYSRVFAPSSIKVRDGVFRPMGDAWHALIQSVTPGRVKTK